ncbi:acyltransferase [Mucilaginibacter phyllosphaerae]|uniref:Acetyltransferase-like isoleucine patch superfamily enzyme n=1 Tax=Mucilaginibacter phyllosphaerae TaxID=1812349 RepID=A0A4Y8A809_9SPHI|nr:acyltransferase [Mucilaginibacter phyllosphaerae]MBB3970511.1 acetyltransferase-like isoleucine patch superfamily enzyme [Mucilaginibacter phyllosphaerae]TEW64526.1 acyltransferase [Mucilaginibacter phyllosphaerae]GGH19225.1 hypothetical protein GCM10007352_30470 [Mucilaginibacter phyllosphaerae]
MILAKIIAKLKGDPAYEWESRYSFRDVAVMALGRMMQLLRGLWKRPFFKSTHGLLFVGHNVVVKHAYLFSAGKNLILEDNIYINALSDKGIVVKNNVSIARNCILICTGVIAQKGTGIIIGNNTGINCNGYLAGQGGIEIGDNVIIGPGVKIFSENHNYDDIDIAIKHQGVSRKPVIIKNGCWIGAGVTILAGVTIGEGCVVAAGSVVTKPVPANMVVGGIPARIIKSRGTFLTHGMAS